jgi:deoxyribodipyrimidine photo-lyase
MPGRPWVGNGCAPASPERIRTGVLRSAGVVPGETYPAPIVPHRPARERALAAFRILREQAS